MRGVCYDCGRAYGNEYGFPDLIVPDELWERISPTGDRGGLLCPSCICRRAYDAGINNGRAEFMSGPFCYDHIAQSKTLKTLDTVDAESRSVRPV